MNIKNTLRRLSRNRSNYLFNSGRFTAIDWTGNSVSVQEFSVRGAAISVAAEMHTVWPIDAGPDQSPEAAGDWLAAQLKSAGITATDAIVCVPRQNTSLKLLELPVVSDEELASLVMLQMESRLDGANEDQIFDYLTLPAEDGANHRHVLVAMIGQSKLDQIQQVLNIAGLNVKAASVGELTLDSLVPAQRGLTMNILANHAKVEFVVSYKGRPLASHAVGMPKSDFEMLANSVADIQARLTATLPGSLAAQSVEQVYLFGPNAYALNKHIRQACDCDLQTIGTECDNAIRTLSLMTQLKSGEAPIDFLNPRRPADANAARRNQLRRYAAGIAVLCCVVAYWIHDQKTSLQTQLDTITRCEHNLRELKERGQSVVQAWQFVDEWKTSSANWSNELHTFTEQLPETGNLYLTQLQLEQPADTRQPILRADGLAKQSEIIMALNRKLMATDGKYELQPNGIEPSGRDSDFRSAFRVDATIHKAGKTND